MISLLIPTMNRSEFVKRLLNYYADVQYKHSIIIGDSSGPEHLKSTKKVVNDLKDKLKIIHKEFPNVNPTACFKKMLGLTQTPYTVFLPDDDFFIPDGLEQCCMFLKTHSEYVGAHGRSVAIALKSSGVSGKFKSISWYNQAMAKDDSASQRVLKYLVNYATSLFSVYRTSVWKKIFRDIEQITDPNFTELLPSCLAVAEGKIEELDCLYLIRQVHEQRYLLLSGVDWIANSKWSPSYHVFADCLSKAIVQQDKITYKQAMTVVKQGCWAYLTKLLSAKYEHYYKQQRSQEAVLGQFYRIVNNFKNKIVPINYFKFPWLINKKTSYYQSFLPVQRCLTEKKSKKSNYDWK